MSMGSSPSITFESQAQATAAPSAPVPVQPARPGDATAPTAVTATSQGGTGTATTVQPPPIVYDRDEIPDEVIPLVGMTLGIIMSMVILFPIARAIGKWIDRRTDKSLMRIADVAPQLRQLQESVDAMAIELERISEAQRFQAKLMAEPKAPAALEGGGTRG